MHGAVDRAREAAKGDSKIGTTGRGIGPAYEDKIGRRAVRLCDLADPELLRQRVDGLLVHNNALLRGLGQPEFTAEEIVANLLALAPRILPFADRVWQSLHTSEEQHVRTTVTNAHLVCRHLPENKTHNTHSP